MHFTIPISQRLNKLIRSLQQKKFRDQNSLFIAEGERLCNELAQSDFDPELIVIREYPSAETVRLGEEFADRGVPIYSAPKTQYDQITNTKSPQGILAVINKKEQEPDFNSPFLALDGVSDPGNVGTIIRTADWFGIPQVFLGRDCADKHNPKTVRSSMGAIFKNIVIYTPELSEFLEDNYSGFHIYGASLQASEPLDDISHNDKYGIIFGSEAQGISSDLRKMVNTEFKIEGAQNSDSLNVAIAVGISLYHFAK